MIRRRLVAAFSLVSLVALAWMPASFSAGSRAVLAKGEAGARLYVALPGSNRLHALDPLTLADVPGKAGLKFGPWKQRSQYVSIVTNAGGTAYAALNYGYGNGGAERPREITIRTFTASGARRSPAFHPPVIFQAEGLTPDGTQLYGFVTGPALANSPVEGFAVLSAIDGHVIDQIPLQDSCCLEDVYDPVAHRLYLLSAPPNAQKKGLGTPELRAYDLTTGRQVQQLTLASLKAGFWMHDAGNSNDPTMEQWVPGFALSPDGGELAILDGSNDTLMTVDTAALTVERTVTLSRTEPALAALSRWLGILPTAAEAKDLIGVDLQMHYSPDGKWLLVAGTEGKPDAQGMHAPAPLPLRLIDAATGRITAEGKTSGVVWDLRFAPDGSAIYAVGSPGTTNNPIGTLLSRYDPVALQLQASRRFDRYGLIGVYPLMAG